MRFKPGRSCRVRGRKVLFGRSYWQTYNLNSTSQVSSRTSATKPQRPITNACRAHVHSWLKMRNGTGKAVNLIIQQEFRAFEVARRNSHVVLLTEVVELSKTPVNESQLKQRSLPPEVRYVSAKQCQVIEAEFTFLFSWSIITLCGFTSLCIIPML